jgi:hypothetical protein
MDGRARVPMLMRCVHCTHTLLCGMQPSSWLLMRRASPAVMNMGRHHPAFQCVGAAAGGPLDNGHCRGSACGDCMLTAGARAQTVLRGA